MNKEEKFRKEIYNLLKGSLEGTPSNELELLNELFMSEQMDKETLLKKIKEL